MHRDLIRAGLRATRPVFETTHLSVGFKRRVVDLLAGAGKAPRGASFRRIDVAGVAVEEVLVGVPAPGATLIYLHGGGYALGSARGYRGFVARLAEAAGMKALIPEYSRSPEAPFPVALDEMVTLYTRLLDDGLDPTQTVIVGDSAGGGMTLALAMRLRDLGVALPAALGLISPWADLAVDIAGTRAPRTDPLITPSLTAEWALPYTVGQDPHQPGISPAYGDVTGLPPVVMHSSGDDPIAADAEKIEALYASTPGAGVLDHHCFPDLWHVFHLQTGFLDAADDAIAELGSALRSHL